MSADPTAIIPVRMGSSRLPGKPLRPVHGRPMLELLVDRVAASKRVDRIAIATTTLPEDDALESWAVSRGVTCFRGSSEDVLGRVASAAVALGADPVIEVLGDNVLVHADLVDAVVELHESGAFDYTASLTTEYPRVDPALARFALGIRVQVVTAEALTIADHEAFTPEYREHTSLFFAEHPDRFRFGWLEARGAWQELARPELNFAVNTAADLARTNRICRGHGPLGPPLAGLVSALDSEANA